MPTNLPPEYFEAEKVYKAAQSLEEKISALEDLISTIPKHKGTDKLRADFRRRLAKLRESQQTTKRKTTQKSPYQFEREGAGQVVIIGPTNVGKSTLVDMLTNATPEVSESPYTTWLPTPGMMNIDDVQVQLVDTPPLNPEYVEPELLNLLRRADMALLMVDVQTYPLEQLEESLAILRNNRLAPINATHPGVKERHNQVPILVAANKCDDADCDEVYEIFRELASIDWVMLPISARNLRNIDLFKKMIFERLGVVRVYAKPPGKPPDMDTPFVLKQGSTVEDLAERIHKEILENLKYARVWGSTQHDGQMVGRDYVLHDKDIVELHT